MKSIINLGIAIGVFTLLSLITSAEVLNDIVYEEMDENIIKVIIELKEEPIIPANKRLSQELPYDTMIGETIANLLGIYDEDRKIKKHKEKIDNEHKKIEEKLIKIYKVDKIKRDYKHLFNGMAFNLSKENYGNLLKDKDIKKVWIDEILYIQDTDIQLSETVAEINADDLWGILDSNGNNITGIGTTVAILDTGVLYNHSDLGGCSYVNVTEGNCNRIEYMYDFANDDDDALDDNGHGTHVAGIIGANGLIQGVAPNTTFMIYKVCDSGGSCVSSDVINAIENATLRNVDIISMSLGSVGWSDSSFTTTIDNAMTNGTLVIIAVGNNGDAEEGLFTIDSPGATLSALTVGAYCMSSQFSETYCNAIEQHIATFSSKGFALWSNGTISGIKPDILAPGVRINSTYNSGVNDYSVKSGTSMATPHASGIASLIKQVYPELNAYELKSAIVNYATDLNYSYRTQGTGLVNAIESYNLSILIIEENYKTNMLFFINNLNSSIELINATKIINLTNRGDNSIMFNFSIENQSGIDFLTDIDLNKELVANESILIEIDIILNNSILSTGMYNNTFKIITNITKNLTLPYSLYTINNSPLCPIMNYQVNENLTLPNDLTCILPDWKKQGSLEIINSDVTIDCNGSTLDGGEHIPNIEAITTIYGSSSIYATASQSNLTIKNCIIKNNAIGIYFKNIAPNKFGASYITNNDISFSQIGILIDESVFFGNNFIIGNNTIYNITDEGVLTQNWKQNGSIIKDNIIFNVNEGIDVDGIDERIDVNITNNIIYNGSNIGNSVENNGLKLVGLYGVIAKNNIIWDFINGISCDDGNYTIMDGISNATDDSIDIYSNCHLISINMTYNSSISLAGANTKFTNKYYLTVNVTNSTSSISGASVTAYDDNGTIDWQKVTDENGLILDEPTIDFWMNTSALYNHTNLEISATKYGYNTSSLFIEMDTNKFITLELGEILVYNTSKYLSIKDTGKLSVKNGVLKIKN